MRNDTNPATKGDVREVLERVERLESRMDGLESRMDSLESRVESGFKEVKAALKEFDAKIADMVQGFGVLVENLRHDILGVRSDEVEVLLDARDDHERRIRSLERKAEKIAA